MILNITDACTIADIVRAAQGNQPVTKVLNDGSLVGGTARAICKSEGGGFLSGDDDVREGYLWVTTTMGFEQWWPMQEVITLVQSGELALNYRA
jgi:hypothetical protein